MTHLLIARWMAEAEKGSRIAIFSAIADRGKFTLQRRLVLTIEMQRRLISIYAIR
jgi:hypothetical protein